MIKCTMSKETDRVYNSILLINDLIDSIHAFGAVEHDKLRDEMKVRSELWVLSSSILQMENGVLKEIEREFIEGRNTSPRSAAQMKIARVVRIIKPLIQGMEKSYSHRNKLKEPI